MFSFKTGNKNKIELNSINNIDNVINSFHKRAFYFNNIT